MNRDHLTTDDYETLLENIADPGHVPFSHHGVQGNRTTVQFGDFHMALLPKDDTGSLWGIGVALKNGAKVLSPDQRLTFDPPCRLQYTGTVSPKFGGGQFNVTAYCVPVSPGVSRMLATQRVVSTARIWKMARMRPKWHDHALHRYG